MNAKYSQTIQQYKGQTQIRVAESVGRGLNKNNVD